MMRDAGLALSFSPPRSRLMPTIRACHARGIRGPVATSRALVSLYRPHLLAVTDARIRFSLACELL